jgi:hypothetical protein
MRLCGVAASPFFPLLQQTAGLPRCTRNDGTFKLRALPQSLVIAGPIATLRHCEEASLTRQSSDLVVRATCSGLPRYARNDGLHKLLYRSHD